MKNIFVAFFAFVSFGGACQGNKNEKNENSMIQQGTDIYSFRVKSLDGGVIDFATFKGKKILIVNTASECGFTPQYEKLEELYKTYSSKLVIVGFPSNDFFGQEPGNSEKIRNFCTNKYHITFPMAEKVKVKGSDMAPIYQWLTQKKYNGVMDENISWNFNKFLIDENGHLIEKFNSRVSPMSDEIIEKIK